MRARRAIIGLAVAASLTAAVLAAARITDSDRPAAEAGAPKLPQRTCRQRIEVNGPAPFRVREGDIRIGPVIFYALGRAATLGGAELRSINGRLPGFKSAVGVRAGRVVTVSVVPADRDYARPDYVLGSSGLWKDLTRVPAAVEIRACPRDEPAFSYDGPLGPTTGFSGGFVLAGDGVARCVTVEIRVKGSSRVYRRAVSFGAGSCP